MTPTHLRVLCRKELLEVSRNRAVLLPVAILAVIAMLVGIAFGFLGRYLNARRRRDR